MTLEEYDQKIKPHLVMIEAGAMIAARHARALVSRPTFESLAEQDLIEARRIVGNALALIVAAQAHYDSKKQEC